MKSRVYFFVIACLPLLLACDQNELDQEGTSRLSLVVGKNGELVAMQCLQQLQSRLETKEITAAQAKRMCELNPQRTASKARQANRGRGFWWRGWSGISNWWNQSFWPGWSNYCDFDSNGYRCQYDYYRYPYNVGPSFLGYFYGFNYRPYCSILFGEEACNSNGRVARPQCLECLERPFWWARRRCLRQQACVRRGDMEGNFYFDESSEDSSDDSMDSSDDDSDSSSSY